MARSARIRIAPADATGSGTGSTARGSTDRSMPCQRTVGKSRNTHRAGDTSQLPSSSTPPQGPYSMCLGHSASNAIVITSLFRCILRNDESFWLIREAADDRTVRVGGYLYNSALNVTKPHVASIRGLKR